MTGLVSVWQTSRRMNDQGKGDQEKYSHPCPDTFVGLSYVRSFCMSISACCYSVAGTPDVCQLTCGCMRINLNLIPRSYQTTIICSLSESTTVVRSLKRLHHTGTEALVREHSDGWRIQINLREPHHIPMTIVGYVEPTLEEAEKVADDEILRHGHICNESCQSWKEFLSAESFSSSNSTMAKTPQLTSKVLTHGRGRETITCEAPGRKNRHPTRALDH